jgi:hypothetical protein
VSSAINGSAVSQAVVGVVDLLDHLRDDAPEIGPRSPKIGARDVVRPKRVGG